MVFLFIGCQGFDIKKAVIGKYYLVAVDVDEDLSLCYKADKQNGYSIIIDQTIFAVGYGSKYIIVKQHPHEFASVLNKGNTNYYILPVYPQDQDGIKKEVFGPFTEHQFEQKKKDLNISNVEFTIVYKNLQ